MDTGKVFEKLLHTAVANGISVKFMPFEACRGLIHGDRIGISQDLCIEDINYTLAHELAHSFLHYDKGDTIKSKKHSDYEEQADRAAKMLLAVIQS